MNQHQQTMRVYIMKEFLVELVIALSLMVCFVIVMCAGYYIGAMK